MQRHIWRRILLRSWRLESAAFGQLRKYSYSDVRLVSEVTVNWMQSLVGDLVVTFAIFAFTKHLKLKNAIFSCYRQTVEGRNYSFWEQDGQVLHF